MEEEKIENVFETALKRIEEKEKKSEKRIKIFSYAFFFVGLELLGILMNFDVHLLIKIIAIDVYAFIVGYSFYKLGLKTGVNIEKKYHKMDNERNKEIISKLKNMIVDESKSLERLVPFIYLDGMYFVSKENDEYVLYDNHKILIPEPDEKALSVAKMAWENSQ